MNLKHMFGWVSNGNQQESWRDRYERKPTMVNVEDFRDRNTTIDFSRLYAEMMENNADPVLNTTFGDSEGLIFNETQTI